MREYDTALAKILDSGWNLDGDRTGVGCKSYIGLTTRYDISKSVPVLTYRKVAWQSIVKEVLWFISGSDNIGDLEASGSGIWTPWRDNQFTTKNNLPDGSIGYGYGPNLIHFGADLHSIHAAKKNGTYVENSFMSGVNQLDYVINTLRANPASRQALFTLWRPDKLGEVKLPPCHHTYHFIVSPDAEGKMKDLSCFVFQRSNDYPIGVGMGNLFGATVFTYLIAQQLGLRPKELVHSGSHCHIYYNALEATAEYVERTRSLPEIPSPELSINQKSSIYDYTIQDFKLTGYDAYSPIKFPIAV